MDNKSSEDIPNIFAEKYSNLFNKAKDNEKDDKIGNALED